MIRDDNPPGLNYNAQSNPHQTGSSLGMHLTDGGSSESASLKKSATLLGAWSEDNPFNMDSLVSKVEDLSRRL